jgi:NAD(P)-dependent dehydrogenase (short-subunit alcohol dehydrogenase family)
LDVADGIAPDRLGLAPDQLAGEVAVVTGGGMGIGREAARALARVGCKVVIAELDEAAGRETEQLIRAEGGTAWFVRTDVSREADVARLAMWTLADYGPATVLVNNAIVSPVASVLEMQPEEWDRTIAVNLRGAYLTCRAFIPGMLERRRGTIINMVSTDAMAYMSAYIASKQGLAGFTQSLAAELGDEGLRVVAFAPGFVNTPGLQAAGERLAPRLGLTPEEFSHLSFHPGYDGMMPAADAGAAVAHLVARLAGEYHGEIVTGYTVLERAGALSGHETSYPDEARVAAASAQGTSAPAGSVAGGTPGDRVTTPEALQQALFLSRELAAMIAETEAEFSRLPIFVRPLARNGFKAKAGQSLQDWSRTAAGLTAQLERLSGGAPAGAFTNGLPRLLGLLARLITYYEEVPGQTARFTKDPAVLAEVQAVSARREEMLRSLVAALKAIRVG